MSKSCNENIDACFGVQVLNEPQAGNPSPTMDNLMTFLDGYFQDAIIAARKHLDQEVPVVLFSWTFTFDYWSQNHFPEDTYGKVMWDTHLYYPTMDTV